MSQPSTQPTTQRGQVVWFADEKGYGFIRPHTECACACHQGVKTKAAPPCVECQKKHPQDVFVHFTAIEDETKGKRRNLLAGQVVEFALRSSDQLRPYAGYVRVIQP